MKSYTGIRGHLFIPDIPLSPLVGKTLKHMRISKGENGQTGTKDEGEAEGQRGMRELTTLHPLFSSHPNPLHLFPFSLSLISLAVFSKLLPAFIFPFSPPFPH